MNASTSDVLQQLTTAPSGIAEFHCWYPHQKQMRYGEVFGVAPDPFPEDAPETAIDQCIDLHEEAGYTNLIWAVGRSTVFYRSDVSGTTYSGELCDDPVKPCGLIPKVLAHCCPLRRALEQCAKRDMIVWSRLAMNRHYGEKGWEAATSRFSLEHQDYHEISRAGEVVSSRLCYAIPEVQQERLDILLEIQRIGVQGIQLDYCRQMPILGYHPAVLEPYMQQTGQDPRKIDSTDPEDHLHWFQYRCDILTGFMRKLRLAVREQEKQLGKLCPIIARVPDSSRWLMLGYGLDIETWAAEDLIDGTMLSPFPHTDQAMEFDTAFQVKAMHDHGKLCIGGVGSKGLQPLGNDYQKPDLAKLYNLAHDQYEAGVDGMSLYQSESTLRTPYFHPVFDHLHKREVIAAGATGPYVIENPKIGCDWHAHQEGSPAFGENQSAL